MASRSVSRSMVVLGEALSGAIWSMKNCDLIRRAWWALRVVLDPVGPMLRVMIGDLR